MKAFSELPAQSERDAFLEHVRATGAPESFPGLHPGPIAKTEQFMIVVPFDVDPKKRQSGDMAPCPMCRPNKFLSGKLVWFPRLRAIAAIGHCCANRENSANAQREYVRRQEQQQDEDYLLSVLPRVSGMMSAVADALPTARAAQDLYRKLKRSQILHQQLRTIMNKQGGRLHLTERVRSAFSDAQAGSGELVERDVEFGRLQGGTALASSFKPVDELGEVRRLLSPYVDVLDEASAIDRVISFDGKERRQAAGDIRRAEKRLALTFSRIDDFRLFFSQTNIAKLNAWLESPLQPTPGSARLFRKDRIEIFEILGPQNAKAVIDPSLWRPLPRGPT